MKAEVEPVSSGARPLARGLAYLALAVVGLYALYFAGLGRYPLIDPDEPVYGEVAKEMATGAGWLTPHYAGQPWFDKPPLFYWASAASASVLGPNSESASRLPSALAAVGLVLLVYALASYDLGRRAGVLSAVVIATCLQQIVLAHAAVTDMLFVFCLTAALYAYRRWLDAAGAGKFGWAILCGAMTGLAMLTKGPVAIVLLGATFAIHLSWTGRLGRLVRTDFGLGAGAALAVGLPWYIAMYALHRGSFVQGFLVANNVTRFLKPEHVRQTGSLFSYLRNVPVLFLFFFPWSVFLPQSIGRAWRASDGLRLAFVWFAVVFVLFSVSRTQLVTYIFPLYPVAAVFVGNLWAEAAGTDPNALRIVRGALWASCGVAVALAALIVLSAHRKVPEAVPGAALLAAALVAGLVLALIWLLVYRPKKPEGAAWVIGTGMAVFTLQLMLGMSALIGIRESTGDLVRGIAHVPGTTIAQFDVRAPSLLFYLGRLPKRLGNAAQARRLLAGKAPVFVVCRDKAESEITVGGSIEYAHVGGRAVIANAAAARRGKEFH